MRYAAFVGFVAVALALAIGREASPTPVDEEPSVIAELASTKPVRIAPAPRPIVAKSADENFSQKLQTIMSALPRREDVRQMSPDEVHHTPKALLDAGSALGDIAMKLKEDPSAVAEGVRFYERCAGDESILTSVRAVCLRNLKRWEPKLDLGKYPEWLRGIAERLPPAS